MPVGDDLQRATDFFGLKLYGDAIASAQRHLQASPEDGRAWELLGIAHFHSGGGREALSALETASVFVPLRPIAQQVLAESYAQLGKKDLAVFGFRRLIEDKNCSWELFPAIAAALNRLGEDRLALRACRALVRRRPTSHQGHFGVAYNLSRLGAKPRHLVEPLLAAIDLAPQMLHYRLSLAFVWEQAGRQRLAHMLLSNINPASICCPAWLRKMKAVFESARDATRAEACERQLLRLADGLLCDDDCSEE